MKKICILACMVFTFSVSFLLSGMQSSKAEELNAKLRGTYAYSGIGTCTQANGNTLTLHLQGQLIFNGDGTGTSSLIVHIINHNPSITGTDPPVVRDLSGDFTYNVESNDYFTFSSSLTVVGIPVTISGIAQDGMIGHGAQTLLLSDTDTNVETLYYDGSIYTTRTCGRNGSAVKVQSH